VPGLPGQTQENQENRFAQRIMRYVTRQYVTERHIIAGQGSLSIRKLELRTRIFEPSTCR